MEYILYSNAKLNLFLHLIGRNEKNYHLMQSAMNFINLSDEIHIKKSYEFEIKFQFNDAMLCPAIDKNNNSIMKIMQEFYKKFDLNEKFSISVKKNIPSGAGLGGGSANAAAILKFLIKRYDLKISYEEKKELALKVGYDTIACLYDEPVIVEGAGEVIKKCNLDQTILSLYVLIIYPQIFSSSIIAYKFFREKNYQFSDEMKFNKNTTMNFDFLKKCKNDLTDVACRLFPKIDELINLLNERFDSEDLLIRMSGSGSTCFALSKDKDLLMKIEKELKIKYPKYFVKICKFASGSL